MDIDAVARTFYARVKGNKVTSYNTYVESALYRNPVLMKSFLLLQHTYHFLATTILFITCSYPTCIATHFCSFPMSSNQEKAPSTVKGKKWRQGVHDPFGESPPFEKRISEIIEYHPLLTMERTPEWLGSMAICRFHNDAEHHHSIVRVHTLYRSIFSRSVHDQTTMPGLLRIGETIACFTSGNQKAVSAITFVHDKEGTVIILFLCTLSSYQTLGIGSFLLKLVYHTVQSRCRDSNVKVFLLCNTTCKGSPLSWYNKRGFDLLTTKSGKPSKPSFSAGVRTLFANDQDNKVKRYLTDTVGLKWLAKLLLKSDFSKNVPEKHYKRFLTNPNCSHPSDTCVYATLVDVRTLSELDKCTPYFKADDNIKQLFDPKTFQSPLSPPRVLGDDEDKFTAIHGNPPAFVSWTSRCFTKLGNHQMDSDMVDLTLAWVQRHQSLSIWNNLTIFFPLETPLTG